MTTGGAVLHFVVKNFVIFFICERCHTNQFYLTYFAYKFTPINSAGITVVHVIYYSHCDAGIFKLFGCRNLLLALIMKVLSSTLSSPSNERQADG